MKRNLVSILLPLALILFSAPLRGAEPTPEELARMSFIEMVNSVDVSKYSELIQRFQKREAQSRLMKDHFPPKGECDVETYRNREVLLVTIPAHLLFAPNSTELRDDASKWLQPFRRYLKDPDMFRVMIVMHTDNTGSEDYRDQLTLDRVDAVYDWFEEAGSDTRFLFPFAMGDELPLCDNTSMENRDRNRRLEVYLVPGSKMLEQAKKGRIEF
ncbi:MAG: OmpA family protein [Bacteroides sp.]|nr:OmpA family protein [Bacteroides sp.]